MMFFKGAKKQVMMRRDCFFISLFLSHLLISFVLFFSPGDAVKPSSFFLVFVSCEHDVQPEAVLPAQGQRCVQVPSPEEDSKQHSTIVIFTFISTEAAGTFLFKDRFKKK